MRSSLAATAGGGHAGERRGQEDRAFVIPEDACDSGASDAAAGAAALRRPGHRTRQATATRIRVTIRKAAATTRGAPTGPREGKAKIQSAAARQPSAPSIINAASTAQAATTASRVMLAWR